MLDTNKVAPSGASKRGSHQLSAASGCGYNWQLRYWDKLRIIQEPGFRLGGTLIHDAVAFRYAERMMEWQTGAEPSWWDDRSVVEVLEDHGAGYPELIENAIAMYADYPRFWWVERQETWDPIAVEEQFAARVGDLDPEGCDGSPLDDEIVTCGTDLLVRDRNNGFLIVVDHKSKGVRDGKLPPHNPKGEYRMSWQAMVNLLIIRHNFPNDVVAGFVINRLTRTPDEQGRFDYDRHLLPISPLAYAEAPRTIRAAVKRELELIGTLDAGGQMSRAYWQCYGRFGHCDYIDVCDAKTQEDADAILRTRFAPA